MSAYLYIEGGGDSKELRARCREGFRRLLERCDLAGRMPRLVAGGGRSSTYDDFKTAHRLAAEGNYVGMLVDSEDTVRDAEQTWAHLQQRDGWDKPQGADDGQVLMMVTCSETWIVTDREALRSHYGADLQESALPPRNDMESRNRESIQSALVRATRNCKNAYGKGKRSFAVIARLAPERLRDCLPSFARCERILSERL